MSKQKLQEENFIKRWFKRIKDKRIKKKMAHWIKTDPEMRNQMGKVKKAFDNLDSSIKKADDYADYLFKNHIDNLNFD